MWLRDSGSVHALVFVSVSVIAATGAGCGVRRPAAAAARRVGDVSMREVIARAAALDARSVWPGFSSRQVPVALSDGTSTLLFRHPKPPPPFQPVPGEPGVYQTVGQHEAVRANTSAELGGVLTATLLLTGPLRGRPVEEIAGVLQHEAFHVFQGAHHPSWRTNEATLFTYPVASAELLHLRRLEFEALRRALAASDRRGAACWAAAALAVRDARYRQLPEDAAAYERSTELVEGLAHYVEAEAQELVGTKLPNDEFAPDKVRERGYASGHAFAVLLDRLAPGWKETMEAERAASLDALLGAALAPSAGASCVLPPDAVEAARARAARDVTTLAEQRAARARAFRDRAGFRVVVRAARGAALKPQGFDPMNVTVVSAGTVLHARWLKLGNAQGTVEVLDRESLTLAAGEHPLFSGIRELVVTGLRERPVVRRAGDRIIVEGSGVRAELQGATERASDEELVIELGDGAPAPAAGQHPL